MDKQHILSHETGGTHGRSRKVETYGYPPRGRDARIHQVQSHKPAGRGKSGQWKPKSIDNRSFISPNLVENRASTSQNCSSDLDFQFRVPYSSSLYESKDTCLSPILAENRASTSLNYLPDLSFQSPVHQPSHLFESKDMHISPNLAENRASTSKNPSPDIRFQAHVPHQSPLYESKDIHPVRESQSIECSGEENHSSSSFGHLSLEQQAIPHQKRQYMSKSEAIIDETCSEISEEYSGSSFDICPAKSTHFSLKPPIFVKNREIRNEIKHKMDGSKHLVLRSGMVLLKNYLTSVDQVKIVHKCRQLGKGYGGFYQPGYSSGTKLHLKMMCLGKNWEPETGSYLPIRSRDGAVPPTIPPEFFQIVEDVIQRSQELVSVNPESRKQMIPSMVPDICIVNFYSQKGKLGLHQDKDESTESIREGLPVVSFSIGDSGDFLYGDDPDTNKAEKVVLESGDVLVFGGDSRRVFHGVPAIHKNTAPSFLCRETNIMPGRLNLTFRKY